MEREQGIGKAGNRRLRTVMVGRPEQALSALYERSLSPSHPQSSQAHLATTC
ncbi:hypothetical protein NKI00_30570 [Mesorhizobium sp. M0847]